MGSDVGVRKELEEVDGKIGNLRQAVENGLDDVGWANARLRELTVRREELHQSLAAVSAPAMPPQLDVDTVGAYLKRFRELVRRFVDSITLNPSEPGPDKANEPVAHEITVNFKAMPAQFVKGMGAGALSVAIYTALAAWLVRRYRLSRNGRHGLVG